ncbi:MAG TPA: ABC transporter permease [Pseudonocardiaceae bacterium]
MTTTDTRTAGTSTPDPARRAGQGGAFTSLSKAMFRGFFRDRVAVFFTFLFPLMFLVVFGLLFRDDGAARLELGVVGDGPVISALPADAVDARRYDTADAAVQAVKDGDVPAAIIEQGGQVTLRFAASDQATAGTVQGLVNGVVSAVNLEATGRPPLVSLTAEQVEDTSINAIQYLTPGLLSWSVATSAVFGSALTLVSWRRRQVLRRLRLSPVSPVTVLTSRLGVAFAVSLLQAAVFVLIASTPLFGLKLSGQWWLSVPLLALGTLAFFAIGMLAGSFAKTEEAASAVANLVVLPMAFLSGTFFPIDGAPAWLRTLSQAFPLRHLTDGMLDVMVRGQGAAALVTPALVLVGFTVVVGAVAAYLFSWDDT